jgi:uncharacterized protein YyaL (SSP411 family)
MPPLARTRSVDGTYFIVYKSLAVGRVRTMPNHLVGQSSPYLLQHADNPVDWYPWGPEALERARDEDKPIFLSIGYSACHWCHVMERESFTNPQTATLLNAHFVSVKVDREERPDLDAIYMEAITTLTGHGGWPLSAWLTPDGAPFYGGTYFPDSPRYGMPSFRQVVEALASAWNTRREDLQQTAARILEHLGRGDAARVQATPPSEILAQATKSLRGSFDMVNGGWGGAPKFPQPLVLEYLLAQLAAVAQPALQAGVESTLDAMAAGGIYDHLGGGFHRYATDGSWLVPHFEKMLYDSAQLARCYLHGWQLTGKPRYRVVTEETLDYLLREMRHPGGGFFSAQDADSEEKEGAFFVWTLADIREALTAEETELVAATYGVTTQGNFEGANILHLLTEPGGGDGALLAVARTKLLSVRGHRAHPARDEKILAGWNGLALAALADAARGLASERYRQAAKGTGEFIKRELVGTGDRLAHSWKSGHASGNGFLEDYACVVEGLLALYQATVDEHWFAAARGLIDAMVERFRRPAGGFYDTSSDHETLITRPRSLQDSPTPSGNSMAATVLLKMAAYTGESSYGSLAEETLASATALAQRAPVMFGQWLSAHLLAETGFTEVAIVGDSADPQTKALLRLLDGRFQPALVIAARPVGADSLISMLKGREPGPGVRAAAWVCRRSTCAPPTSDPDELRNLLVQTPSVIP